MIKLERTIEQYRNGDPKVIAEGSKAQIIFALEDSRDDVLRLARHVEKLEAQLATIDPALVGIAEEMKESGGHWMPCTGCYDTEDGHPTQKYAYSPALQTDIGCGCHECGGLGAVWWHMTDEELAQFEKECAGIDASEPRDAND